MLLGETKRRSLSIAFGAMFRRNSGQKEAMLESTNNGYRFEYTLSCNIIFCLLSKYKKIYVYIDHRYYRENETVSLDLPINAIIFAEWLKELSAICQEHTIS